MAAGTAHAPGRTSPPAPAADPNVDQIRDQGIAALKQLNPSVGEALEVAVASMNIQDSPQTRSAMISFMNSAVECAQATAGIDAKVKEAQTAVFPTLAKLNQISDSIDALVRTANDSSHKMAPALASLRAADSSATVIDLQAAQNAIADKLSITLRDKDPLLAAIQTAQLQRAGGPAAFSNFPSIYDGSLDAAPVNVGVINGVSLELFKDAGKVYARFSMSGGATIEYRLDEAEAVANASVAGASPITALLETNSRIQGRLHEVLTAWNDMSTGAAGSASDPALLIDPPPAGRAPPSAGFSLIARSAVGKAMFETGAKISLLKNGQFMDENVIGLDLSGATLDNFKINFCYAHNMSLAGAILKNGTEIFDNFMNNANCARMVIVSSTKGGGNKCLFNNNDMHGTSGSLMGADFGDAKVHQNNLMGVNMNGVRSDSMRNVHAGDPGGFRFSKVGAAKAAFKDQFRGSSFELKQMANDTIGRQMFENNSSGVTDAKALQRLNADISQTSLMRILDTPGLGGRRDETNPLLRGYVDIVAAPADPGNGLPGPGRKITVKAIDGSGGAEGHSEDGMRHGYYAGEKGAELVGNLELLNRILKAVAVNRNGVAQVSTGLGATPSSTSARTI